MIDLEKAKVNIILLHYQEEKIRHRLIESVRVLFSKIDRYNLQYFE